MGAHHLRPVTAPAIYITHVIGAINALAIPPFCTASSSMSSPLLVKYRKIHNKLLQITGG